MVNYDDSHSSSLLGFQMCGSLEYSIPPQRKGEEVNSNSLVSGFEMRKGLEPLDMYVVADPLTPHPTRRRDREMRKDLNNRLELAVHSGILSNLIRVVKL